MDGWLLGRSVAAFAFGVDDGAREVGRHGAAPRPDAPRRRTAVMALVVTTTQDRMSIERHVTCHDVYSTIAEMLQILYLGGDETGPGVWQACSRKVKGNRMQSRPIAARRESHRVGERKAQSRQTSDKQCTRWMPAAMHQETPEGCS
jgi:hypothetical protein